MLLSRRRGVLGLLLAAAALFLSLGPVVPVAVSQDADDAAVDTLLIITTPSMQRAAVAYAKARREAYDGALKTDVMLTTVCQSFHREKKLPDAIRAEVLKRLLPTKDGIETAQHDKPILPGDNGKTGRRYLLLIGDVPTVGQPADAEKHVPCFYKHMQLVEEMPGVEAEWDDVASDNPYSCRDEDDDVPQIFVGRLPVSTPEQLATCAAAVKEYETEPPAGDWQRKVTLFAGDPGFRQLGEQVRGVIEKSYEQAVIKNLDDRFSVTLTYANPTSPYTWPAPDFGRRIVEEVNEGAMFLNYLGHGWKDSVDTLKFNGRRYEVFTAAEAAKVDCRKGRPVAAFFTCYTGCFDMRGPSLAEALITNPRGPIGVMASSRVSNEINLLLEMAFLKVGTQRGAKTLGELFTRTEREMLTLALPIPPPIAAGLGIPTHQGYSNGKRVHLWLYNLFGDPTVRLQQPRKFLGAHAADPVSGRQMDTVVAAPETVSRIDVRLEALRDTVLNSPAPLNLNQPETDVFEAMRDNHGRVNNRLVATASANSTPGHPTKLRISVPARTPAGRYIVRVLGYDDHGTLVCSSATRVTVKPGDGTDDF